MKNLVFLDMEDEEISVIDFSNIYRGHITEEIPFQVKNNGTEDLTNILIEAVFLSNDTGSPIITSISTFLSEDQENYDNHITIDLDVDETKTLYMKYQPPSNSIETDCFWGLKATENGANISVYPEWSYKGLQRIQGSNWDELIDYKIQLPILYQEDFMNPDFSDIRFSLEDGTILNYYKIYCEDEVKAIFLIEIPTIPAHYNNPPFYINIYSGNENATDESDDTIFDFFDSFNDLNNWDTVSGTPSITNSILTLPDGAEIRSNFNTTITVSVFVRAKITAPVENGNFISPFLYAVADTGRPYYIAITTLNGRSELRLEDVDDLSIGNVIEDIADNEFHIFELDVYYGGIYYKDGIYQSRFTGRPNDLSKFYLVNNPGSLQSMDVDFIGYVPFVEDPPTIEELNDMEANTPSIGLKSNILKDFETYDLDPSIPPKVTIHIGEDIFD